LTLSKHQLCLLAALQAAVAGDSDRTVCYVSEWLGYLPFGTYQWLECHGQDITDNLAEQWSLGDLQALALAGSLLLIQDWQDPQDEFGRKVIYRVA
jgi:hypothetical protein